MMNKNRTVRFIVLMFFVIGTTLAAAQTVSMQYENGLLSASIQSATIKEIFEELKRQTGLTYEMDKEIEGQKVTVEFKDMSLKAGIEKVLDLTGLKDLAISYKDVGAGSKPAQYEVNKVEIRKRTKAEMEKIEAEEEETRREEYQKKEKWYHNLFKDMGKKGKLEGMLKDYAEGKVNNSDIQTYLRQATIKPEEKPILKVALADPKYAKLQEAIEMGFMHAVGDHPEETDKEFLLELFKARKNLFLMYSLKFIWDERFIPVLIDVLKDKEVASIGRGLAAEILGVRKVKEAIPALEEAMVECPTCGMGDALERITGKFYKVIDGKAVPTNEPPKSAPDIERRHKEYLERLEKKNGKK